MKVYVLFHGSYSDRSEVAAFSNEDVAKAACLSIDGDITEFDLDPAVFIRGEGMNVYKATSSVGAVDVKDIKRIAYGDYPEALTGEVQRYSGVMHTYCFARDEAHAIEIAADRFRQFVATNNQKEGGK